MLKKKAIFDPTSNQMCHMTNPLYELLKFDKLSIFLHLKCVFSQNLINTLLICNFTINILESADPWILDRVESGHFSGKF